MSLDDCSQPSGISSAGRPAGWDGLVLARIGNGDSDALREVRWQWGEWICNRLHGITHDWMSASLLTAGVFVRLWRTPADFAPGGLRHSLLSLAEQRAYQWMADTAEDTEMPSGPEGAPTNTAWW